MKGPHFAALHPLFESFATSLATHNDDIAERAVTLGALAHGTARHVAKASRLPEYPQEITRDLEHAALLADRIETTSPACASRAAPPSAMPTSTPWTCSPG